MDLDFDQPHNSFVQPTIRKDALVLVTGVNGFIGSHVADQLIKSGYKVRGTVRAQDKAAWLYELFANIYGGGQFEAVEVSDMAADGAFDIAVQGVEGVVHVASVMVSNDKAEDVILPTVKGTLNMLTSASQEPGVRSVVCTSSSCAALFPKPNEKIVVTKDSWNSEALEAMRTKPEPTDFEVYAASKTEAEKAAWKAYDITKPHYQLSAVLPNANFGASLNPDDQAPSTAKWIQRLYEGDDTIFDYAPPQWFIDVQDTARLHVAALIDPSCKGERLFAFAEPFNLNDILAILRRQNPGIKFMDDREDLGRDLSDIPHHRAERLLRKYYGKGFTKLRDSVKATVAGFSKPADPVVTEERTSKEKIEGPDGEFEDVNIS